VGDRDRVELQRLLVAAHPGPGNPLESEEDVRMSCCVFATLASAHAHIQTHKQIPMGFVNGFADCDLWFCRCHVVFWPHWLRHMPTSKRTSRGQGVLSMVLQIVIVFWPHRLRHMSTPKHTSRGQGVSSMVLQIVIFGFADCKHWFCRL
jgi:hypothetical protein